MGELEELYDRHRAEVAFLVVYIREAHPENGWVLEVNREEGIAVVDPAPGQSPDAVLRIAPGDPARSALAQRIGSRWAALQMPPLGTETVDGEAYDLIRDWIADLDGEHATSQEARERGK